MIKSTGGWRPHWGSDSGGGGRQSVGSDPPPRSRGGGGGGGTPRSDIQNKIKTLRYFKGTVSPD